MQVHSLRTGAVLVNSTFNAGPSWSTVCLPEFRAQLDTSIRFGNRGAAGAAASLVDDLEIRRKSPGDVLYREAETYDSASGSITVTPLVGNAAADSYAHVGVGGSMNHSFSVPTTGLYRIALSANWTSSQNQVHIDAPDAHATRVAGPLPSTSTWWEFNYETNAYAYLTAGSRTITSRGSTGLTMSLDALALERVPIFVNAESGTLSGGAVTNSLSSALGGQYVTFGATGLAKYSVFLPAAGNYRIGLAGWPASTGTDEIRVSFNSGSSWTTLPAMPINAGWSWRRTSTEFFLSGGFTNIWFKTDAAGLSNFYLDAFFVEPK